MKKLIGAAAAAALAVGAATAVTATASAASGARAGYTPPKIQWGQCSDPTLQSFGAQCGMLTVPLDYAKPNGSKIKLAVSRVLHKKGAKYQGVMLTNPGGPGGSGLILSIYQNFVPNGGGDGYDWIGFDPRGVGSSVPALACDPTYVAAPRKPYKPSDAKTLTYWLNKSQRYAKKCTTANNSELFRHIRTVDNVADMESIRIALGQKQINYYGFSYGTYLGQVYATLHPDRVRRFVWDGVVNPDGNWYKANLTQDVGFQKTFDIYFRWLAKYHSVYHVGNTYAQVRDTFLKTQAKLNAHPAKGVLGGDELLDDFTSAGYYVYEWEDIAQEYSELIVNGNPDPLISRYLGSNPTTPGSDNGFALYLGTQCTDKQWPKDITKVLSDNRTYDKKYPYFTWGNGWFNGPCNFWPFKAGTPVKVSGKHLTNKILMIEETYDAATPFAGALAARQAFPSASMIEGYHGSTHAGSLSGVACTDDTIANYLLTGKVPARKSGNRSDKVCPPVPQPDPSASGSGAGVLAAPAAVPAATSRAATSQSARAALRQALYAAQVH